MQLYMQRSSPGKSLTLLESLLEECSGKKFLILNNRYISKKPLILSFD